MTIKLIDISYWQSPESIDYLALSKQVDGVILRAAYGTWQDKVFLTHYDRLVKLGIPLGAYHFIVEYKTAQEQANLFWNAVNGKDLKLGYWCDVELENGATPLTRKTVDTYINSLEGRGMSNIGFYSSRYYWDSIMRTDPYKNYKLWVAHYGATSPLLPATGGWKSYWLWQYTSQGRLAGYNGNLDMNYFWGGANEYNAWVGEPVVIPPVENEILYVAECVAQVALNIRKSPQVSDNIVGQLKNGDKRPVYEEFSGWLRIPEGWVSANYMIKADVVIPDEPSDAEKLAKLWAYHPEVH